MYQISSSPFGKYKSYRLFNLESKNEFTLVPERGACVIDIQLGGQKILDGCRTPEEVDFNDWGKSALLFPFPNRLRDGAYIWQDKIYQFPINDATTGNALHGFLKNCTMQVTDTQSDNTKASITCEYSYNGTTFSYYPFPFDLKITYTLSDEKGFSAIAEVHNTGYIALPMSFGWHPYFKIAPAIKDVQLQLPKVEMVGVDARMLPTGKRYEDDRFANLTPIGINVLDNCFSLTNHSVERHEIILKSTATTLIYWQDKSFPFIQLFTPPNRDSIAIEPMSGNVDVFNNEEGLIILESGEQWQGTFGVYS